MLPFNRTSFGLLFATIAIVSTFMISTAEAREKDNLVGGKLGYVHYLDGDVDNFDNLGINLEYQRMRLVQQIPNLGFSGGLFFTQGSEGNADLQVIGLQAHALLHSAPTDQINIYGGGGLGIYRAEIDLEGWCGPGGNGRCSYNDSETDPALDLVGGVSLPLGSQFNVIAEVTYALIFGDIDTDFLFFAAGGMFLF